MKNLLNLPFSPIVFTNLIQGQYISKILRCNIKSITHFDEFERQVKLKKCFKELSVLINSDYIQIYKNFHIEKMSLSQQKIDQIVKDIFIKYDSDKSGYLEKGEIMKMLEDSLKKMNKTEKVQMASVKKFIEEGDNNKDGKIQKTQMKEIIVKSVKMIPSPDKKKA